MLSRFLTCPERFRVSTIEGIQPKPRFSHLLEYGQLWHVCEEAHAAKRPWRPELKKYAIDLRNRFPENQEDIAKWYEVCRVQFPVYVNHWEKNDEIKTRTPVSQEQVFDVKYELPSGSIVRLRGKMDAVDYIEKGVPRKGIYLHENKTKGDVDVDSISRQLTWDFQTMMYLTVLTYGDILPGKWKKTPVCGIRYNVVRRPLSGGAGSIKQKQPTKNNPGETLREYYDRLGRIIDGTEPESVGPSGFFWRWTSSVTKNDVDRFRRETLDPILQRLVDWYDHVTTGDPFRPWSVYSPEGMSGSDFRSAIHYRHPFGCVNSIDEYGWQEIDQYLQDGSMVGLVRREKLFEEL